MDAQVKMRDRRSTNLFTSSDDSVTSGLSYVQLNEKQLPNIPSYALTLPTFVRKENSNKPDPRPWFALAIRIFFALCGLVALWQIAFGGPSSSASFQVSAVDPIYNNNAYAGGAIRGYEPSILMVSDNRGDSRWTVHIPHNYSFPLHTTHAQAICREGELLRDNISGLSKLIKTIDWVRKRSYLSVDRTFLEIGEAEERGVLPESDEHDTDEICEKSLTFAFENDDASFGKTLLMLWLSYGLARQEQRAFFIDDSRWAYGNYTSFFAPAPSPGCLQPPAHQKVPCPHSARHLLVSSATLHWTFGASFEDEFYQWRKAGVQKSKRIFDLLRHGYEDLFRLTGEDALYAASRVAKFKEEAHEYNDTVIGMHIRRGDLHPFEPQFSQDYLPLQRYETAARGLLDAHFQRLNTGPQIRADDSRANSEDMRPPLVLATDDPEIFDGSELTQSTSPFAVQKAQKRIELATKSTLDLNSPAEPPREFDSVYVKYVEENVGFEGGFYNALFFSLGEPRRKSGDEDNESYESSFDQRKQMRELVGRAYVLDLAVLGRSDGIVCAISSATCRLLAVMQGYDAVKGGKWVNVDDNRDNRRFWTWDGRR